MIETLRREIDRRPDLKAIYGLINADSRVLDLGCGNGAFLKLLEREKNINGLGVEISQEKILESVRTGIAVLHADLNDKLIFDDKSFDFVVLSQTLQAVKRPDLLLNEMLRVGKTVLVSFMNIGHLKARLQLLFGGRMPVTKTLPYHWYDTPNIHLSTAADFRVLCSDMKIEIIQEIPLGYRSHFLATIWPNLFAPTCVFRLQK